MPQKDRRSGRDRRKTGRVSVNIDTEWEGLGGRRDGTISDISEEGCFILTSGEVADGETVRLFIPFGEGMNVQFYARVVNHAFEIGFAVKFVEMTPAQREFLDKFLSEL